ncbi:hypothetical protein [Methylobacterium trifolii]|uniref:Uncharacterized protein n=1 Tax=Methylobacterium trifolii TaxID=1003092 RepID=A0ABQ4U347_9HYPH|nr:hypothetical protein [Methylobacterium trifolii]GJE61614.1 hypothetical protein MPOCJGCO_3736 [Methylobacterium trifolii]
MATCDVALVRQGGVNFAIVCVADHVINSTSSSEQMVRAWTYELGVPVALMGARQHNTYGRRDIVDWLSNVHPGRLPWRRATLS